MTEEQNEVKEEPVCEEASAEAPKDKKSEKKAEKQLKEDNKRLQSELSEKSAALEKASADLAEMTDKYLRICAEYDNFRKRSAKEKESVYGDAYSDALKEILPVIDNLERACVYNDAEKLTEGLKLIFKSASDMLEKLGITWFGEAGDKFDPNLHNAVMHVEDEAFGEEEITEVFQKGYRKGDRVIRHAMVKVAN